MNSIDQETLSLATVPKRTVGMASLRALPRIAAWLGFAAAALFAAGAQAAQGDNLALGKPVTMSGTSADPTLAGANCTDGNTGGNYPTDKICGTGATMTGANREWIEVDLGQDYIIDRVRLSNRTDGSNGSNGDFARWIVVTTRPSSLTGVTSDPLSTLDPAINPSAPFVNKIAYASGTNSSGGGYGTGQAAAWNSLDMKVGTHIARYVRIYTMKPATLLSLAEIEVFEGAPPSRTVVNPSFELPSLGATSNGQISETLVPGWSTTDSVAIPNAGFGTPFLTGGNIELWKSGFGGVLPDDGNQFAELNAYINGALSPAPLCVYPGETFTWRVSHRARGAAGSVDVARLRINGQDIATMSDGSVQADPHTCTPSAGFTCTAQGGSPTSAGWGRWQGTWTSTLTQPKAMTFEFAAISSASGSPGAGNFIDAVSITGLTAAIEFSTGAATGPESVATANLPKLLINGPVTAPQTIELDIVGGTATRGSDYTTNPATGAILVTIPPGNYDGTAATAIALDSYIQIVADALSEGAETIVLRLANPSGGLSIAGASGCRAGIADSTYTITDEPAPTLSKHFAPATIPYGGVTTMTFLIDNSVAGAVTRPVGFTDNLAAGLQIATPANATTTCGGAVTAVAGGNSVSLSGGTAAAGTFCSVSVSVTNRPGFSGLCYNPNFANENQNLVGLQNLIAQIEQYTCVSVTPPDCPDSATTNGFGNISGLSPNLNNGISGQCIAVKPTIQLVKISNNAVGSFGFTLGNTSATNPVTITTTAPGAPGTSSAVFDVVDLAQPVTVAESTLPANWVLSGMACQLKDGTPIGTFDNASRTWTAAANALAYGQQITCTVTNTADRFDFGDAPDTYGTLLASNGARHGLVGYDAAAGTAPLMLGARVDHENDGFPGTAADGDDSNGIDDEDAFFGAIALQPGSTAVSLDVPVTNTTAGSAHLYAWIDFNGNGRFDASEAGNCAAVAAAATQVTCTWTAPAPLTDGFQTYARFRLTTQTLAAGTAPNGGDARALGAATDGEVEDHRVSVATVLPLTCEAPFVETFGSYPVTPGAAAGWGPALPAGTTTYAFQSGPSAVDEAQYGLVTKSILGNPAWQNAPDHTQGDTDGFMMIVNGSASPGVFYRHTFSGLSIGARYNFFASLANIVAGFNLGLPDVTLRIVDPATSTVLASIDSGGLPEGPAGTMPWRQQQLVFTATQSQVRIELANNSGVLAGNDVALDDIGFAQVCELGDAPDSYATLNASNGAGHLFPGPGLSLGGGLPDGELDGQPSPNADGDDLNGIDDENAFPSGAPALVIGAPYSLNVPVETTAGAATACAWVDLDKNGSFSAGEGQCQSLAAGTSTVAFTWPGSATTALTSGQTYLRLRIERNGTYPADMSTADFAGARGPGEVEDYVVPVLAPASVSIVKALTGESGTRAGQAEPGEQLTYTITLTNAGGVPATNYGVTDALDPNVTFVSATNGGTAAGGVVTWSGLTVPANGSLTLTVVVKVADPIPAGVTQIGNVAYQTGTTPPACPPAGGQCVIVPTAPKVAIAKALTAESGTKPGQAEPGEQLTYTITLTNTGGSDATNYGVTDTLDPNVTFVSATNGGTAAAGAVTWSGLTVPKNGSLTLTIVVKVVDPIPAGVTQIGNVAYETGTTPPACPPAGGQCVVVPTAPKVAIAKTAGTPAPAGAPNQYSITYVVAVKNDGGSAGTYDLADTLTFNGATVTAVSTPTYASSTGDTQTGTLGAFTAPAGGTIVTGEGIAAGGAETWTYTVTYTITDAATAADCATPSGGLRNHALLGGSSAGAPAADTCSGAPRVSIVKTAAAPVPTANPNQFTMTYTVNVSNSGTLGGVYDLGDTLSFHGATVNAISAPAYSSSSGDTQTGTLGAFAAPTGGTIVTGEGIAAGGAETWTYTVTYTVTDAGTAQDCANPNGGLRNKAELGGSLSGESTTCTGAPAVVIGKSVGGPVPTGNANEYALDYLVTVQNNGTLPGLYDLADTFTFAGVNVVSVSAITHGGSDPLATTLGTLTTAGGTIVTGESIAAGANETYAYRVVFTVTDVAAVGTCAAGGGLKNQATLGGSSSGQVGTCSDVPNIAVTKSAGAPTPTGTLHQYTMTYTVSVANGGAAAGRYDLSDTFAFAGATVDAVSAVTHGGSDPLATTLGTLTTTGGSIVTGETIAAAASETYSYTVTFTVTDPATAADCTNPAGGLRNKAALGGSVSGDAPVCVSASSVAVTKALTAESGTKPGQAEPGEQLTYTITLTNTGGSAATNYGVTDTLDPNVTFVSATNGGTAAGGAVTWTGLTVPANGTLTLTVVVQVVNPIPAGVTQIGNVAYETGTTPPACPPAGSQCVVVPTAPQVAIVKTLTGESGSIAGQAEAGEQLTYTIILTNTGGSAATNYGVTDTLDPNVTFVSADNGGTAAGGVVTWSGLTVPANGTLTLTVVVQVANPIPAGVTQIGNVAYETGTTPPACPPAGGQCVVVPTAPKVAIAKALTAESGTKPGEAEPGEQLTYTITLTNNGGSAATNYGVTDTLDPNVTFVSATNGGTAAGGVVTWSGLTVPANGSLTLTIVVKVVDPIPAGVTQIGNVAYETGTTPPACPPAGGQCVIVPTAPKVSISKSAGTPAPTGTPNQYTLTYTVTVHNAGGSVGTYDLADTLTFNGAAITAISAPAYASSSGDTQDGLPGVFAPPAGGTIVSGERINAQGTETWTYTVTYTVDDADVAANCAAPNGGLRNHALLGGSSAGAPAADTCTGAPSVSLVKHATAPVPTGTPNQFTLTYTVDVANIGSLPGNYDLTDVLSFHGATVNAITAPAYSSSSDTQDGTLGTFTAPIGGTIVSGETISAGGKETWTYTVTYTVTDAGTAQDCANPSGGLRNKAELGGSMSGESTTCTGAAAVVIGKSVSGPVPTGNANEYRLSYLVTVQNNGTLPGTYDLADSFTFAGVSNVVASAVQHGGGDPLATTLGTLTATGGTIVSGESIAAGASETYAYSVTFTLDDVVAVGTCAAGGGLKNHASLGGSSSGQVETCSDVPDIAVTKSATGPVPTGTANQYTLTYTVSVTNTGLAAGSYDLADTFAFAGATVDAVSAVTHSGSDPLSSTLGTLTAAGGTIVSGETIGAAVSETYTYTVTFTLTDPALANDCANPAGGLRNHAALGGSAAGDARTCTGTPRINVAKALTGESGSRAGIAEPGEQLTYTITLTNAGTSAAVNQSITDRLDPNVTFVSASNGGAQVGGNVEWTGLTVPAGGNLALTVVVRVVDPIPAGVTSVGNVAYDPTIGPPDCTSTPLPPNCTHTPTPGVVTIVKALAAESGRLPGVAEPGEQLTYTITLTNTGGSDATNYGVTDALDPNTTFVSADNGGSAAGGVVTWSGLTVPANGSLTLTVVVRVVDPLPAGVSHVANVAYQTGTTPPACPPAGGQCVVIPTEGAVVIVKALAAESGRVAGVAEPGEQLTYTITLTNTGGSAVTNYGVEDRLDPNTSFVSADNGGAFAAGVVAWSGLTIPANGSLTLTVVVQVADPIPAGVTQIGNVAYQTGTPPPSCPPAGGQCVIVPTAGAVTIAKSVRDASGNGQAEPGEQLTYTITLTNSGGSAVTNYGVSDPLDANTTFVSADNGGAFAGGVVAWSGLTIPANGTLSLTVVVTVNDPLPAGVTQIGNVAYQTGTTPPDCSATPQPPNCTHIEVPPPTGTPQLLITKTSDTSTLTPGGTVVYTITVRNVGTATADNVVISDPIPTGLDAYAWTCAASGGASCPHASGSGAISESIAQFPAGATVTYTVVATVSANPPETVANTATVTPSGVATCAPSGTHPPCPATVVVTAPKPAAPVPAAQTWALLLIGLGLIGFAWRARRRHGAS